MRQQLRYAVKTGKVIRQPCEVCGAPEVAGHHEDYSKPLEANWLCKEHHRQYDKRKKTRDDLLRAAHTMDKLTVWRIFDALSVLPQEDLISALGKVLDILLEGS